jgi:hypothetical protein
MSLEPNRADRPEANRPGEQLPASQPPHKDRTDQTLDDFAGHGVSVGQAALRYFFEDLEFAHAAREPLSRDVLMRVSGIFQRLANGAAECGDESTTRIVAGGMTELTHEEALVFSQFHSRGERGEFLLPPASMWEREVEGISAPLWRWAGRPELFVEPVGVIAHVANGLPTPRVFPVYSPGAQEEAVDHVAAIAADFNRRRGGALGQIAEFSASSLLLGRVLREILESNDGGDKVVRGNGRPHQGTPLLGISRLGVERGAEVAFRVELIAVRAGDVLRDRILSGLLVVKDYTVTAQRGPLAFESVRVVDVVERAA